MGICSMAATSGASVKSFKLGPFDEDYWWNQMDKPHGFQYWMNAAQNMVHTHWEMMVIVMLVVFQMVLLICCCNKCSSNMKRKDGVKYGKVGIAETDVEDNTEAEMIPMIE